MGAGLFCCYWQPFRGKHSQGPWLKGKSIVALTVGNAPRGMIRTGSVELSAVLIQPSYLCGKLNLSLRWRPRAGFCLIGTFCAIGWTKVGHRLCTIGWTKLCAIGWTKQGWHSRPAETSHPDLSCSYSLNYSLIGKINKIKLNCQDKTELPEFVIH